VQKKKKNPKRGLLGVEKTNKNSNVLSCLTVHSHVRLVLKEQEALSCCDVFSLPSISSDYEYFAICDSMIDAPLS